MIQRMIKEKKKPLGTFLCLYFGGSIGSFCISTILMTLESAPELNSPDLPCCAGV